MALQLRRGSDDARLGIRFQNGELIWASDTRKLYIGDGATLGGKHVLETSAGSGLVFDSITQTIALDVELPSQSGQNGKYLKTNGSTLSWEAVAGGGGGGLSSVSADTNPALGGNLTLSGYNVTGTGNINITGTLTNTGNVVTTGTVTATASHTTFGSDSEFGGETFYIRGITDGTTNNLHVLGLGFARNSTTAPQNTIAGDYLGGLGFKGYRSDDPSLYESASAVIAAWAPSAVFTGSNPASTLNILTNNNGGQNVFTFNENGAFVSSKMLAGDGDVSSPSIGFSTDGAVDTGFYHPGDGVVGVTVNGVEKARFDSGGFRSVGFIKVKDFSGTLPNPPEPGMIVLDGSTFKGYNGSAWVNLN